MAELADEMAQLRRANQQVQEQFLDAELQTCLNAAEMAELEFSMGQTEIAEIEIANAERGLQTIQRFVSRVGERKREECQAKAAKIQARLDGVKLDLSRRRAQP